VCNELRRRGAILLMSGINAALDARVDGATVRISRNIEQSDGPNNREPIGDLLHVDFQFLGHQILARGPVPFRDLA
jgi:hypothetical protein